jgi:hypothetical protein
MKTTQRKSANTLSSNYSGCIKTILNLYSKEIDLIIKSDYPGQFEWDKEKKECLFFPFDNSKTVNIVIVSGDTLDAFFIGTIENRVSYYIWWEGLKNKATFKDQIYTCNRFLRKFSKASIYLIVNEIDQSQWEKAQKENVRINLIPKSLIKTDEL